MSYFIFLTCLKGGTYCVNKKMKTRIYATMAVKGLIFINNKIVNYEISLWNKMTLI